ncbi:conserved protein of unknown function [Ruminococcaceae bacterium BL-6]|nr:conserved protein of unknown function [Ruminococcaceae bacterium BL-6]
METKDYVITDGDVYLAYDKTNGLTATKDKNKAKKYSYESACNVVNNHNIPKNDKRNYKVVCIYDLLDNKNDIHSFDVSQISNTKFDWNQKVNDFNSFYTELQTYKDDLHKLQEKNEAEICDLYHYIEFFDLSASQGFKAYKMLQKRLKLRRNIKDEEKRIGMFFNLNPAEAINGILYKKIDGINHQQYAPRILKELFNV